VGVGDVGKKNREFCKSLLQRRHPLSYLIKLGERPVRFSTSSPHLVPNVSTSAETSDGYLIGHYDTRMLHQPCKKTFRKGDIAVAM
jgi:hypothetical protein